MWPFNQLAALFKSGESAEEEKLLLDLNQGLTKLKEACTVESPTNNITIAHLRANLEASLVWFNEAKKRIKVVEVLTLNIERRGFVRVGYRSSGIKVEDYAVLTSLKNAERDLGRNIKDIHYVLDKYLYATFPSNTVWGETLAETRRVLASMKLCKEKVEKIISLHKTSLEEQDRK